MPLNESRKNFLGYRWFLLVDKDGWSNLFAIAFALRRGPLARAVPLALAVLSAISEFGITAAIAEVRPSSFGAGTVEGAAEQFQRLHLYSRLLFGLILCGTAALIAIHVRESMFSSRPAGDD